MNDQSLLTRYLLGGLPERDAERIEEEYFASDDRFSELLEAEDDLIEGFLHGRLNATDRRQFEARFLATERGRAKVAMAAVLEKTSAPVSRRGTPTAWLRPVAIAAAIVLLAIGAGLMRELLMLRQQIDQLGRGQATLRREIADRTDELRRLRSVPVDQRGAVFSIVLTALERSAAPASILTLPRDADAAELWLLLPRDAYPSYAAALQSIDGKTIWSARGLRSRSMDGRKVIVLRVPAASLAPGTFIVSITGEKAGGSTETVEDLSFSVRRP